MSSAITDDELVMKSWLAVGKDFPKPNIDSFMSSEDSMNTIKLKIASLEKTKPATLNNKVETENSNDTMIDYFCS